MGDASMDTQVLLWILVGMNGFTMFIVAWIKSDIAELWKRADGHGHSIECDREMCRPRTTAVILPEVHK